MIMAVDSAIIPVLYGSGQCYNTSTLTTTLMKFSY